MSFGKKIKNARIKLNMTQKQVAEKLNIKTETYSKYERNLRQPDYSTLVDISNLLNISVDFLLESNYSKSENDFLKEVDLSDEELLRRYSFTYEGKEISEEEVKRLLKIIRALEDD